MSIKKILHLATDEKFINAANYLYERAFPGRNTFYIIKPAANPPLKFVKLKDNFEIHIRSKQLDRLLAKRVEAFDIIVFHGLNREMINLINHSEDKKKFIWTFWGAEVYNSDFYDESILGLRTKRLKEKLQKDTLFDKLKEIYRKTRYPNLSGNDISAKRKAMNQFHYIAKLNQNICPFKKMGLLREDCQTIPFTYYPLEYLFEEPEQKVNGENILLGNSSSATNNHLEMIEMLSEFNLDERKVITPLSYGSDRYASAIKKYGKEKLGNSFYPLTEFIPLKRYNKIIQSCGYVIMNHYRPQGVGTILASLYLGSKVFLNDTPFYRYLKNLGCYVYSIEDDLEIKKENAFQRLPHSEIEDNRKILREKISTDSIIENIKIAFKKNFNI